jgi:outer membrane protein assembly factor BamB
LVYVGSRGGYLYAFNVADGSYVPNASGGWQNGRVQLVGGTVSTPYVESTPQGDVIYTSCLSREVSPMGSGADKGSVYAFHSDGRVKWRWDPNHSKGFNGSPVIFGDTLYVGCLNKNVYALNKETGAVKWQFTADNAVSATSVVEQASDGYTYVYFSDDKAEAYKLRDLGTTCSEVWQASLGLKDPARPDPGAWHISPALSTDYVYFGCQTKYGYQYMQGGRGYFEALQKTTGQSDQQYMMEADLHSSMRVGVNNWLYFGSCENLICGVDLNPAKQESKLLW